MTWLTRRCQNNPKLYWIGGLLLPVIFSCVVIIPRNAAPGWVSLNRLSILSVYAERERAHLQSYLGMIASTNLNTSIQFGAETLIRPLTPTATPPLQLIEDRNDFQLHDTSLDAWVTQTYLAESFVDFPSPVSIETMVTFSIICVMCSKTHGLLIKAVTLTLDQFLPIRLSNNRKNDAGEVVIPSRVGWNEEGGICENSCE